MASTNETPVLGLPQFIGTDKPSWLGDVNGAMLKIDTAVGENQGKIGSVETVANSAESKATAAQQSVNVLGGKVVSLQQEQSATDSRIDAIEDTLDNLPTSSITVENLHIKRGNGSIINDFWMVDAAGNIFINSANTPINFISFASGWYLWGRVQGNPFKLANSTQTTVGKAANLYDLGVGFLCAGGSNDPQPTTLTVCYDQAKNTSYIVFSWSLGTATSWRFVSGTVYSPLTLNSSTTTITSSELAPYIT